MPYHFRAVAMSPLRTANFCRWLIVLAFWPVTAAFGFAQIEPELPANLVYENQEQPPAITRMKPVAATVPEFFADSELPKGLDPNVEFRFLTFGDETSRVVTIAVLPDANEIWIDRNRDHVFSEDEHVGAERECYWRTTVPAEFSRGQDRHSTVDLSVAFQWSPATKELTFGTIGSMRGKVALGEQQLSVVRTDENSNGRWFDPEDRIWIDFNDNKTFEPFRERFECQSFLVLGKQRFVIAADEEGLRFSISDRVATGELTAKLSLDDSLAKIEEVQIELLSREGIPVKITSLDSPTEVPAASYRVTNLRIRLRASQGAYAFEFKRDSDLASDWIEVTANQGTAFDPLGELDFNVREIVQREKESVITVLPSLTTTTGLYLTRSTVGLIEPTMFQRATTSFYANSKLFDASSSGFS